MKKENIILIIGLIATLIGTGTSVYAANYVYNGKQVSYNNGSSGLVATNVQAALDEVYAAANDYATMKTQLVNAIYPIGAVYCSAASTNPNSLFGGGWTQIKDRFILAAGDTYKNVKTVGGEATHTLTTAEMPAHNHGIGYRTTTSVTTGSSGIWVTDPGTITAWSNGNCIQNAGGGQAHNNMPPYVIYYCWERTS